MATGKLLGKPDKLQGSDLQWISIPSRRSRNTSSSFMLQKPGEVPAAMNQSWLQGFTHIFSQLKGEVPQLGTINKGTTYCSVC